MSAPVTYAGHTWPSAYDWCLSIMQHNAAPGPAQNGQRAALGAYRAEVLAADGQAYNGELSMLRGLVATLRAVAKHGDLGDVQKLLAEHERDEQDAYAEAEKNGRATAGTTPDTLASWLYQRFMSHGVGWDNLSDDDRQYWEHQASAVRRAVARGGFKTVATEAGEGRG
jgi:hypothetical protein